MLAAFRRQPRLAAVFLGVAGLALGFLLWALTDLLLWEPRVDEPVRPWMTVGYVARSWDLDPRAIDQRAGLPRPVGGRPFTLQEIARQRDVPAEEIVALVESTVRDMKAEGLTRADGPVPDPPLDPTSNPPAEPTATQPPAPP